MGEYTVNYQKDINKIVYFKNYFFSPAASEIRSTREVGVVVAVSTFANNSPYFRISFRIKTATDLFYEVLPKDIIILGPNLLENLP